MEKISELIKYAYQQDLINKGETDKAIKLANKDIYEPVFTAIAAHPEEEPNTTDLNTAIMEIGLDIAILNNEIMSAGHAFANLMNDANTRLNIVQQQLLAEEERLRDINILCGNYTEFDRVITLTDEDFSGNFSTEMKTTFMAYASNLNTVDFQVISINGNGYEGNEYVYVNNKFLKDTIDTSKREFMNDSSTITAYEYSRLIADANETIYPPAINFDQKEAECGIVIGAKTPFNTIKITSDIADVIVKDVLVSSDNGTTFTSVISKSFIINNPDAKYESGEYIYSSGIICFPKTTTAKLVLSSKKTVADKIAFKNIDTSDAQNPTETIVNIDSAKRYVIKINDINARIGVFSSNTTLYTDELIESPIESMSIFANEYIPEHFPFRNYFKYILTVNGIDYEITPINSHREGIKIIKTSNYNREDISVERIDESIKSAKLTVVIMTPNNAETPYVSNIKICFGKKEVKYV